MRLGVIDTAALVIGLLYCNIIPRMPNCYVGGCSVTDRPGKNVYGFDLVDDIPRKYVSAFDSEEFVRQKYGLFPSRVYTKRENDRELSDLWNATENVPVEVKWVNPHSQTRPSSTGQTGFHFHGSNAQHRYVAKKRGYYYVVKPVLMRPYAKIYSNRYDTRVYRRKYPA